MRINRTLGRSVATLLLLGLGLGPKVAGASASGELAPKHVMLKIGSQPQDGPPPGAATGAGKRGNGITYHGGPILLGTPTAYVIWYGNWPTSSTTPEIVNQFLNNVGGSPYYKINATYTYGVGGTPVTNAVAVSASSASDTGTADLSDVGVKAVVERAITSHALPNDPNGVYFVLTSAGIQETSGFLTQYCGWHTHGTIAGSDIQYSFVGDPTANLSACSAQAVSPNGNVAADAMVSVIAHELEESVTDPDLNAWFDSRGYENADKCAWTFGATYLATNGSKANVKLGGSDFLIQQNWVNASGGYCAMTH